MPAYVIVETDVHDPERYEQYRRRRRTLSIPAAASSSSVAESSRCSRETGIRHGS